MNTGKIVIENGDADDKHRGTSALILINGVQIFGPKDFKQKTLAMEAPVNLTESNSLLVELRSKPKTYLSARIIQDFDPPTVSINANPTAIKVNENSILTWDSILAYTCSIAPDIGNVDINGSITVSPDETTTYIITATGPGGISTADTTITHVNSAPVAGDQSVTTNEDIEVSIILTASDLDNDPLVYQVVTKPAHGVFTGAPPNLTYTPDENYYGPDSFTFKANDGLEDSNVALVSLTIVPVNDPPVANDDTSTTDESTLVIIDVLSNDMDPDGNPLSVVGFTQAPNGTVADNGNGTLAYTSIAGFSGTDTFTYTVSDGTSGIDTANVYMTVIGLPASPTISFSASPACIPKGGSSVLTWTSSSNAQSAFIDNGIGLVPVDGFISVSPHNTTIYILSVTGPTGSASAQAVVKVLGNPAPQPEVILQQNSRVGVKPLFYYSNIPTHNSRVIYNHS